MILHKDGTWECGADETSIPDGAMRYDDDSDIAQTIRQYDRVSVTVEDTGNTIISPIADKRGEIISELEKLDLKAVRPLRAIAAGTATEADKQKLAGIEAEAKKLRKEIGIIAEEESANGQ